MMDVDVLADEWIAQCMWNDTTHVGIGWATGQNGSTYVCGRYNPAGNWAGNTPY